ncbi:hypothetical protein BH09DEP1_BH09DEP1_4440 [soil metagenome]
MNKSLVTLMIIFAGHSLSTLSMELPVAATETKEKSLGWKGWIPFVAEADKGADGINKVGEGFKEIADAMKKSSETFKDALDDNVYTLSGNVTKASGDMVIATEKVTVSMDKVLAQLDVMQNDGIKMGIDPVSIRQVNAASNNMAKTWITAGAGGALTLAGLILLLHTLTQKTEEKDDSDKAWYMRIITNRYLISVLLIASGLTLILKSDKLVTLSA